MSGGTGGLGVEGCQGAQEGWELRDVRGHRRVGS